MLRLMIDFGNASSNTGIGLYGRGLLEALRTFGSAGVSACEAGISSISHRFRPLHRLVYLAKLSRLRGEGFRGADVVHFVNQFVPKRVNHVSYVTSAHDLDPILVPEAYTRRYSAYFRQVSLKAVERSHLIEAHTEAIKAEVAEYFSVNPDKIRVIGDGLSREFMTRADSMVRNPGVIPLVLFVGQIGWKKNVGWLVRTVAKGIRNGALPRVRLILAGSPGYGYQDVESALADAKELAEWRRRPTLDEIVGLYRQSSVLVLPSRREGFGRPMLEAMYCDVPVVASRIPSLVEVGQTAAVYFELDNEDEFYHALQLALEDKNRMHRMQAAVSQVQRYSWKDLAKKYITFYHDAQRFVEG